MGEDSAILVFAHRMGGLPAHDNIDRKADKDVSVHIGRPVDTVCDLIKDECDFMMHSDDEMDTINSMENLLELIELLFKTVPTESRDDGGAGSGNHGHAGVPGKVGGSAPSGTKSLTGVRLRNEAKAMSDDDKQDFAGDWLGYSGKEIRTAVRAGNLDQLIEEGFDKVDADRAKVASAVDVTDKQKKAVSDTRKEFEGLDVEHSYSYDEDGTLVEHAVGKAESADISVLEVPHVSVHNHPASDTTFSPPDIETLGVSENMRSMTVYTDRAKYTMSKGEGATRETIAQMQRDYEMYYRNYRTQADGNDKLTQWMYFNAHKYGVAYSEESLGRLDALVSNEDGGPGSGNWGHSGRQGKRGGSSKGSGGVANRLGSKESGFTSKAKERKNATPTPAPTTMTGAKIEKVKAAFGDLKNTKKLAYLERAGVISTVERRELAVKLNLNDNEATDRLKSYEKQYFEKAALASSEKDISVPKRDEVSNMTPEAKREWVKNALNSSVPETLNQDSDAQKIVHQLGMNGTPQMMCSDEFDDYVQSNGAVVIYRGVRGTADKTETQIINQMAYDTESPYIGNGVYGDGLYFSTLSSTAESYSNSLTGVAKCALRKDAKVYDYPSLPFEKRAETSKWLEETGVSEASVYAMCAGYDAIRVRYSGNEDYYVVLNKAAMVMKDPMDDLQNIIIGSYSRKNI